MKGKELLEKRLELALTRLEQKGKNDIPSRYEPSVQLIEVQRLQEFTHDELKLMSKKLRHSYETRNKNRKKGVNTARLAREAKFGKEAVETTESDALDIKSTKPKSVKTTTPKKKAAGKKADH
jgi:hypothetical protein